jgi:hypothetical protein
MDAPQERQMLCSLDIVFRTYWPEQSFGLTAISSTLQRLSNYVAICISAILPRRNALVGGGSVLAVWSVVIGATSIASTSNLAASIALSVFMITWSMLCTGSVCCLKADEQIVQREREEKRSAEAALVYLETEEESISGTLNGWISLSKGRIRISAILIILGSRNMCLFHSLLCWHFVSAVRGQLARINTS